MGDTAMVGCVPVGVRRPRAEGSALPPSGSAGDGAKAVAEADQQAMTPTAASFSPWADEECALERPEDIITIA